MYNIFPALQATGELLTVLFFFPPSPNLDPSRPLPGILTCYYAEIIL